MVAFTLNLNDHTLIFQNLHLYNFESSTSDHHSNNAPSSFLGDATLATTVTNNSFGRITVNGLRGDPSLNLNQLNINFNQLNSLTIILTGLTTTIPGPQGRTYIMLGTVTNGGTIILPLDSKVVLDSSGNTNPFVDWSYSQGVLKEMPKPDHIIQTIISNIISNSGGNNKTIASGKVLTNSQNTDSAAALRDEIITAAIVNPTSLNEIVQRLEPVVVEATEATHTSSLEAVSAISDRISRLSTSQNTVMAQNEGISAGNENPGYGMWSSGYYSKAVQKGSSDKPGYNSKTFGGTLGVDKSISDTLTLGLAVSLMSSKIKHSDSNSGDRTTSSGQLLSLYSLNNLTSNLFLQAIALAGTYKINNRERRFNGFRYEIAKGSYRTFSYGTELMLGYDFNLKEYMTFTPLLGLSYYWINKSSYQESGTTNQNFHVSKQFDQKLNGILGAKFTGVNDWNGITFLPEVHGLLRYDLINKDSKIIVSLDGLVDPLIKSTRQEGRAFINLGLGLNAIHGRMEYGLT